ncbi:alpha/beta fold hydrolase [Flavobacterium sp. P21]|uniref:alpha/beta fold hydrolase n=1 Tax=Flavobacterium sp. P21 TaxID=3423948 RepID=UPI003D67A7F9
MSTFKVKDGAEIYYKDWGTGQPIVFHHGWPLSSDDWDAQMMFFVKKATELLHTTVADTDVQAKLLKEITWKLMHLTLLN